MNYRRATVADAGLLARLNKELIVDEGHRNAMCIGELEVRMAQWLEGNYAAVLFEREGRVAGYALYRREVDHVYLRQFFVCRDVRREGVGREAIAWLRTNAWERDKRVRLDVLFGNAAGIAFWRSMGFGEYCVTMEQALRGPKTEPNCL